MAKQKGIVFFEGTLGGINFYYLNNKPTARVAGGGFTSKAVKKSPNMKKVREQNSEFRNCSYVNKAFKAAIRPMLLTYKDGTLHSRLMQLFLQIKHLDAISMHGQRTVANGISTDIGKQMLQGFKFTPKRTNLLPCAYRFDWDSLTFKAEDMNRLGVGFPKSSDFMEVTLSVIRFDFETLTYTTAWAPTLVVERHFDGDSFNIAISQIPEGKGLAFAVVNVAFYQDVNGKGYLLKSEGNSGIELFMKDLD
ncbi:hypothetical protein [Formosa sp. A9]|uniref:hypothetical protein n=1 Tax=Formosa sp. A9 TaxID=3442641 RepID=UPI003EBEA735